MRVVVVGGGVVGLGLAYELAQAGAEVTVLERARVGAGASQGNTGWITPALLAMPIAAPGVVSQALKWMARPDSPFLLRPTHVPAMLTWLWRFWRSSSSEAFARGQTALIAHNRSAIADLLRWREQGVEFELHKTGLVFTALNEETLDHELRLYADLREGGFEVDLEALSAAELQQLEPAMSPACVGGLFSPGEWHVRPESLTAGLADALRRQGAEVVEGVTVKALARTNGQWVASTSAGTFDADAVVITTGVWVNTLLQPLGFRVPIEAAKGYSITSSGEGVRPQHAVYLLEARVGCSPYSDAVRLAGTLELAGLDTSLRRERLRAIERAAEIYMRWRPTDPRAEWAGLRPVACDTLPVIGPIPGHDGLFVSTGHAMGGVTLAAASATLLAPAVLGAPLRGELGPLSPARFAGGRRTLRS